MGGFYDFITVTNGGPVTMTLSGGEPGMMTDLLFTDANSTLSVGAGAAQFALKAGQANPPAAGSILSFRNDGQSGTGGNRWTQK